MENHHFQWVNPRTKRLFPPISNPSKNHRSVETAHGCHRMTSDATNDSRGLGQGPLPPPAKQSQGPEIGERAKLLGITFFFKCFFGIFLESPLHMFSIFFDGFMIQVAATVSGRISGVVLTARWWCGPWGAPFSIPIFDRIVSGDELCSAKMC